MMGGMGFQPRFSLRMLFAAITLFAIWLGWQMSVVRERKNMRAVLEAACGPDDKPYNQVWNNSIISAGIRPYQLPWFRKILGDELVPIICLPPATTLEQRERFKQDFPEAWISVAPENPPN